MTRPTRCGAGNCWRASTLPDPPCWSWTMCTCWLPRRRASAFSRYWPGRHEQSAHRAHHPAFPNGRRPAGGPQGRARPPRPGPAGVFGRRHPGILRPVRPQDQPGPDPRPAWGHGRMGQRRISALPPLRATRGFFPARLRPFFHPALPAIFLLIFPAVFRERTATGYGRPFGRTALSATLPGRAGHAFRALSA